MHCCQYEVLLLLEHHMTKFHNVYCYEYGDCLVCLKHIRQVEQEYGNRLD